MMPFVVLSGSGGKAILQVVCVVCEKPKQLTITTEQLRELTRPDRRNVQFVLPEVPRAQRELLITGTCGDCWNELFLAPKTSEPNGGGGVPRATKPNPAPTHQRQSTE